jgi:very-short-patch-repair endonuclease
VLALKGQLDVAASAYRDAASREGLAAHPWFGVGDPSLDYFGRERCIERIRELREALNVLRMTVVEIGGEIGTAVAETIKDAQRLREALDHLPVPELGTDGRIYAALEDPEAFDALERFQARQAEWLEASQRLAEMVSDPESVVQERAEINELVVIAKELQADTIALGGLAERADELAAEAERIERAVGFVRQLAISFRIESVITVDVARKLMAGAKAAGSLSRELRGLRHPALCDDSAESILVESKDKAERLAANVDRLTQRLSVVLDGRADEWHGHARALRDARFPFSLWRVDVRVARRLYKRLLRAPARTTRDTMAADFEAIAACADLERSLAADSALQAVTGPHFRGHKTPFDQLLAVHRFAVAVRLAHDPSDKIDFQLRHVLLEGPSDTLARIAQVSENPEMGRCLAVVGDLDDLDPRVDLDERGKALRMWSARAAEVIRRSLAIGIRREVVLGDFDGIARAATARTNAQTAIEANDEARQVLGAAWRGPMSDRSLVLNALAAAVDANHPQFPPPLRRFLFHPDRDARIVRLVGLGGRLNEALGSATGSWSEASACGLIDEVRFFGTLLNDIPYESIAARLDRAVDAEDQLSIWSTWLSARKDCADSGLAGILDAFQDQALEGTQLSAALDRVLYRTLTRAALSEHPALGQFRGLQLDKAREQFRRLDEETIRLQQKALAAELCRRPIDPGQRGDYRKEDTGLVLVHHEIGKQKRHIPIRELLDRAGQAIRQLKPCFMMSPLSVAQFLKPGAATFDLVVIDEASQMRPEEALGAVARGGQLVVVGDPKQLPPTSFFDRTERPPDEEMDQEEIVDNESILDLALAEFRPARELRWHYRSRHESLIAFSNRRFYGDALVVFPSPLDPIREKRKPKFGVFHHFVAGKYKGHVNITEARAVAEAAVAFMGAEANRSLGMVTLNQPQRDLLLEEMERKIAHDQAAQRYVEHWEGTLEPFFVKNLENVQGDERDVIFISTVYGPDAATGIVMNRFGPINGIHGHRRLNVLFTRAKNRIEVFTSMRPGDIRAGEGSQPGVHALRAYLEYAENGKLEPGEATGREPDSEFEELVLDRLRAKGFEVTPQVGVAGYFIDLAVKHPKRSGYLLGIECDGATYHSSRSARDRDRLRQEVLERLEWNIYRIWSTDWFHNPDEALRRLLSHINTTLLTE